MLGVGGVSRIEKKRGGGFILGCEYINIRLLKGGNAPSAKQTLWGAIFQVQVWATSWISYDNVWLLDLYHSTEQMIKKAISYLTDSEFVSWKHCSAPTYVDCLVTPPPLSLPLTWYIQTTVQVPIMVSQRLWAFTIDGFPCAHTHFNININNNFKHEV